MQSRAVAVLIASVAALVIACSPAGGSTLQADYDRNLATWQSAGITRYAFDVWTQNGGLFRAYHIVSDGSGIRISGEPRDEAPIGVEGLFQIVRTTIDRHPAAVVTYDETTGVPMSLSVDRWPDATDGALAFDVTDWTVDP